MFKFFNTESDEHRVCLRAGVRNGWIKEVKDMSLYIGEVCVFGYTFTCQAKPYHMVIIMRKE